MTAQGRAKRRPGIDGPRPSRSPERARQPVAQRKGLGIVPIAGTRPFGMPLQGAGMFADSDTQGGASRLRSALGYLGIAPSGRKARAGQPPTTRRPFLGFQVRNEQAHALRYTANRQPPGGGAPARGGQYRSLRPVGRNQPCLWTMGGSATKPSSVTVMKKLSVMRMSSRQPSAGKAQYTLTR